MSATALLARWFCLPALLLGLARCRFYSHELDQAQELLDTLLATQPDHVDALVERGRLALCRGQVPEAEQSLARATSVAPWHREASRRLHACLEMMGKSTLAEQCQVHLDELQASDRQAGNQ